MIKKFFLLLLGLFLLNFVFTGIVAAKGTSKQSNNSNSQSGSEKKDETTGALKGLQDTAKAAKYFTKENKENKKKSINIYDNIALVVKTALSLIGVVSLIIIIYAGFLWMTAQGDTNKVDDAKKILKGGIMGLLVIFFAYFLITVFFVKEVKEELFKGSKSSLLTRVKIIAKDVGYNVDKVNIYQTIGNILKIALSVVGVVSLIIIIYAGFLWMTAQGDTNKVDDAKKMLKDGVIGLLIVSFAYLLVSLIFDILLEAFIGSI